VLKDQKVTASYLVTCITQIKEDEERSHCQSNREQLESRKLATQKDEQV
jgi:hypothetical protein